MTAVKVRTLLKFMTETLTYYKKPCAYIVMKETMTENEHVV